MQADYIIILITSPSEQVGERIAQALLEERLAACVNIVPNIQSIYSWKGEIQNDEEALLVVKSRAELFDRLVPKVKAVHPYEVPEIIALPLILGAQDYLDWITDETIALAPK